MTEYIGDLEAQSRKHELNWMIVSDCLSVIEKQQSTLSEDINDALQKAQQCVKDSLPLETIVHHMQNVGSWLNTPDLKSVSIIAPVQLYVNEHTCLIILQN